MKTPFLMTAALWPLLAALLAFNPAQAALVQWFKLDEGAADPTTNKVWSTGFSNTGTNTGGVNALGWTTNGLAPVPLSPPAESARGTAAALSLNGNNSVTTDYLGISGNAARSIACWIKTPGSGGGANPTIVSLGKGSANGTRFDFRLSGNTSSATLRLEIQGTGVQGGSVVADNNWHHVVVTFSGTTIAGAKFYVDGALSYTATGTATVNTTADGMLIGDSRWDTTRKFYGLIDDVRIYDHALSLEEVQALALAPAITNLMASQTNVTGNATFNSGITAFGAGLTGLTNQWSVNGVDQPGETGSSFTIIGASVGIYAISVRSGNAYGMVTNSATLVVQEPSAVITAPSTFPASVSTTYGTASASTSVSVSGTDLTADITATAPTGFEVSNDDSTWGPTTTFTQSGGSASGTLYLRLKNNAPVTGSYNSVNVVLSSPGAESVNVATTASGNTVSPKALNVVNVTALDKMYDGTTAGIVIGSLDTPVAFGEGNSADGRPYIGDALLLSTATGTFASPDIGTGISVTPGTFTLSGAAAGNYTLTQPTVSLTAAIRDTAVWTNPAGGSWTNINNWENGAVATGTNNTADFTTLSLTANRTVTLDGARPIGNLWFADQSGNGYTWTIPSGGGPLTLAVNSGTPVISNSTFTTITVQLAGSQGFQKTGTGILRLNNTANPITGEILVSQGFLQIRDGTVNSPTVFAADTMDQRSLRTTGSGTTDLFRLGAANNTTVTWSMPALTLETGGTLRFRNDNANTITHNLAAAVAVGTGGGKIVNSGTTGTGTQNVNLSGALSGTGALEYLANSGTARRLTIASADNSYSGDWTVAHTSTGTAFLRAGAANALGSGTVTLNAGATLENNAANGLDSLAGVTLNEMSSMLDLSANPWNNASATLTAKNGTIQLGTASSAVGTFVLDSTGTVTLNSSGGSLAASTFDIRQGTLAGTGALGGTGSLTKSTAGTATLSGAHTYTGTTTVSDGTLLVNGSLASGSAVTVEDGATLGGTGTIGGPVTVNSGGTLSPGASIGTLTLNSSPSLGGTTLMEIDKGASPNADKLVRAGGSLTYGGTLTVQNIGPALTGGEEFDLFDADSFSGVFTATNLPALGSGLNWWAGWLLTEGKLVVNRAPDVGSAYNVTRAKGVSAKIRKSDVMAGVSDPDAGDSPSFDAVDHGSYSGTATVTEDATYVYYVPGDDNDDVVPCRIKDTRGGVAIKHIHITVQPALGVVQIQHSGGGQVTVNFYGIPGYHYVVQRSCGNTENFTDLSGDLIASPVGLVEYQDTPGEGCNPAFYRIRSN